MGKEVPTATTSVATFIDDDDQKVSSNSMDVESDGETAVDSASLENGKTGIRDSPGVLEDRNNPQMWSRSKKIINNTAISIATFALTYSSSVYSPSIAGIEQHYAVTRVPALCSVSLFVLGFGVGPFLAAPISEVIGRKPVYLYSYALFAVWSWAAAYAPDIASLIIFRFLAGMSGSSSLTNHPASVADFTTPAIRNRYLSVFAFAAFGGAAVGPLTGGFIVTRASWHWNLVVTAIFVTVSFLLLFFTSESYAPVLLARQNREDGPREGPSLGQKLKVALVVPFKLLFTEPILAMAAIYLSVLYGVMYSIFATSPIIYLEIREWSEEGLALSYISLTLGFLVGAIVLRYGQDAAYTKIQRRIPEGTKPPPDARFCMMFYTSWLVPFGIFLVAFCSYKQTHWFGDVLGMFCFAMGSQLVFMGIIPFIVDVYLPVAASANAACVAARCIVAAGFPLFSTQMYHKLGVPGASCLLACIAVLLTPLPFLFRYYRETLLRGKGL